MDCSKGEKVVAKAHGGPIEIFGVTVAQVDDKVRLQELDTWFDPLDMFRQIAPKGIVNKEDMNRKVNLESALDVGPDYSPQADASKTEEIAQPITSTQPTAEPIAPRHDGVKIAQEHNQPGKESTAPEQVVGTHVSESTGERADSFVPHQGADTEKPAAASNPSEDVPATLVVETAAKQGAEAELEHPDSNFHDAQEHQPKDNGTAPSTIAPHVPKSIYSSAVTGNVEDRIKMAEAGQVVDESKATGTYDAVDQHLESSSNQVHPHPHDAEKAVQPEGGEAVAVPPEAGETRMTHEEMSRITPTECPFLMNRE